jgi:hypothetical protein
MKETIMDPLDLIDHPPQNPVSPTRSALTAAVMARVRRLPVPRSATVASRPTAFNVWWLAGALVLAAGWLLPTEWLDPGEVASSGEELLIELAVAGAAMAATVWLLRRRLA